MKNNKIQDERELIAKRKIQSDGFQIIWLALMLSVLIQQYLFSAPFSQYVVEILIFILMSIYIIIANIRIGIDIFTTKKRGHLMIIISSLVTGVTVSIINTTINYINYGDKMQHSVFTHLILVAVITFISSTALAYIALRLIYLINYKKQQVIEKKLNAEDIEE